MVTAARECPRASPTSGEIPLERLRTPLGLSCPKCGATAFKTFWQTFENGTRHVRCDCAECGAFVRYLKQPGAPEPKYEPRKPTAHAGELATPPADWHWIGLIRQDDEMFHPVALAPTRDRCWDALLHFPGEGDRLIIPTRVVPPAVEEAHVAPVAVDPATAWAAWHRPGRGQRWQQKVTAASQDDVMAEAIGQRLGGDWCFLPACRDPNARAR
ncbi:MAG TPA: hypothetical protein VFW33_15230 [Gemmataceae bacterium]|nr:hypothetical protein [Gemmataceae bacterium]